MVFDNIASLQAFVLAYLDKNEGRLPLVITKFIQGTRTHFQSSRLPTYFDTTTETVKIVAFSLRDQLGGVALQEAEITEGPCIFVISTLGNTEDGWAYNGFIGEAEGFSSLPIAHTPGAENRGPQPQIIGADWSGQSKHFTKAGARN